MAEYQITLAETDVVQLLQRDGGFAALLTKVLNQVLEAQVTDHLGAQPHERSDDRQGYRNGYRERELTTRVGTLTLRVPRVRDGSFSPELFARYQRSEQAFVLALCEMVVQGVSTRKVNAIVEELCRAAVSKSQVSVLCQALDPLVTDWRTRKLDAQASPFVLVDALVVKVRLDGRVRQQAVLIATGVRADGYREILGFSVDERESTTSWGTFFRSLHERGLSGVDLVVSDDHAGLVAALGQHFPGASWQRCQAHFTRNIIDACPQAHQGALAERLRALCNAPDLETARTLLRTLLDAYGEKAGKAMDTLEAGFEDAMAVMPLPASIRTRLRTTNSVERLNEEVRRRERVIRIFPNVPSVERLLGAVLQEHDEAWTSGKRYLDLTGYWQGRQAQEAVRAGGPPLASVPQAA